MHELYGNWSGGREWEAQSRANRLKYKGTATPRNSHTPKATPISLGTVCAANVVPPGRSVRSQEKQHVGIEWDKYVVGCSFRTEAAARRCEKGVPLPCEAPEPDFPRPNVHPTARKTACLAAVMAASRTPETTNSDIALASGGRRARLPGHPGLLLRFGRPASHCHSGTTGRDVCIDDAGAIVRGITSCANRVKLRAVCS